MGAEYSLTNAINEDVRSEARPLANWIDHTEMNDMSLLNSARAVIKQRK